MFTSVKAVIFSFYLLVLLVCLLAGLCKKTAQLIKTKFDGNMANWLQKNALDYGGNPEGSSIKDVRTDGEGRVWPNADKNGHGGEGRFFCCIFADVLYG